MPRKPFEVTEEDFAKTVMDYLLYEQQVDVKQFADNLIRRVLYSSKITSDENSVNINIKTSDE